MSVSKKISVIVPVYNTKDYLLRCLNSIRHQTYTNLEIICIDDGSTDGSEEIVDNIASVDHRFIVYHQSNKGESCARNEGLKIASGDYITFVDCDDWIENDMYSKMLEISSIYDVDIVSCGFFKELNGSSEKINNQLPVQSCPMSSHELLRYVYRRDMYRGVTGYIWCKLFKREIIERDGKKILFDEDIRLGGDILYFANVALNAKNAIYINEHLYHYVQRKDSNYHSNDEIKWYDMVITYKRLLDYLKNSDIPHDIIIWVERFLAYRAAVVAQMAYKNKNPGILLVAQKEMQNHKESYIKTNIHLSERIQWYNEILSYKI